MLNTLNLFKRSDMDAVHFQAADVIFHEGSEGHDFYVVLEGEVDIIHNNHILFTLGPGEIFGEMAIIDSTIRSADAVAKTACKLAVVNEKRFLFMVQQTPYFALTVMKLMSGRMRQLREMYISSK